MSHAKLDWQEVPLKHLATLNPEVLTESTPTDYQLAYVDIGSVSLENGIEAIEEMAFSAAPSRARRRVRDGDTIVSTVRTYLRAIAPIVNPPANLVVSTGFAVVRPRADVNPRFLSYALRSSGFVEAVVAESVGVSYPAIAPTKLGCLGVWIAPLAEQRAIADFLDRETTKIDALIAKQEELVGRIEEHKRAYIFAGVTKGIDPAAALKSSGVAWLGDVPAHWEIRPLKRFVQFHAGAGFPDVEQGLNDQELPFFKVKDLGARGAEEVLTTTDNSISRDTARRLRAYTFPPKTIVMAKIGAALLLNRFRMVGVECCLDNNMLGLECDQRQIDPDFALMLMGAVLDMRMLVNPGAVPSLNETRLGRLAVAAPSLAEQRAIVDRLRATTNELDRLRQAAGRVADSLQERRSALITAAVTGQIEVAAKMAAEAAA